MTINIDATPQEVAELVFALVDCDVECDIDDDRDLDGTPLSEFEQRKLAALNAFADALSQLFNKPTT